MEYSWMHEFYQEERRISIEESGIKKEFKERLKGLINISGVWDFMEEDHEWWLPLDIIDIHKTGEVMSGYPNYETCREVNDEGRKLYLKHSCDIRGVKYYYVWQTGHDDSYNGYLLFPLKNGKFLKINYTC